MRTARIRILVADDHKLVRSGLARLLNDEQDMEVVGEAGSGEESIGLTSLLKPDVVLMSVEMPGIGALETTRRILRKRPKTQIIALSALQAGIIPLRMLRAGAVAFITQGIAAEELILAVRCVHGGERYITSGIAAQLALNPHRNLNRSPFDELTQRELQITLMFLDCTRVNAISTQLCLSPKTVYSYRYRIFEKLGLHCDVELTILAVKYGLSPACKVSVDHA